MDLSVCSNIQGVFIDHEDLPAFFIPVVGCSDKQAQALSEFVARHASDPGYRHAPCVFYEGMPLKIGDRTINEPGFLLRLGHQKTYVFTLMQLLVKKTQQLGIQNLSHRVSLDSDGHMQGWSSAAGPLELEGASLQFQGSKPDK